ncbi:long chain acyl-CoA synthetase 8-like [Silene latifolia]|uniref:long chain acyl-CoA synthetase 8-like n=1 Tax=Silene latifolia TaxID=37657 RepID=UPI003D786F76
MHGLVVEAALLTSNYVDNVMVYADPSHNYYVALIAPSHSALEKWAKESSTQYSSIPKLCNKAEAIKEVQTSLSKAAKEARLDMFEIPAKIKLVADPWTPESGLVTTALKLKREQLKTKYKSELDKLYTRSGEFIERYRGGVANACDLVPIGVVDKEGIVTNNEDGERRSERRN